MEKKYVIAVKRESRKTVSDNWKEELEQVPGLSLKVGPNPHRVQVEASAAAIAEAKRRLGEKYHIETTAPRQRQSSNRVSLKSPGSRIRPSRRNQEPPSREVKPSPNRSISGDRSSDDKGPSSPALSRSGMILPPRLQPGDRVAAVSLSWGGAGTFPHRYQAGKDQLSKNFGVEVVETKHALRKADWLARNPQARAEDLMEAFADKSIRGIISMIGGDDSIRLLPYLELDVIRRNPKVFLGYSDTTTTHLACYQANLVSFYGPSIMAGFAENGGVFSYLESAVRKTLFKCQPIGVVEPNPEGWTKEHLDWAVAENQSRKRRLEPSQPWKFLQGKGQIHGHLLGGCLEVLEFLKGTPWWPAPQQWKGAILFLETSEEAPSPKYVTRFLRNMRAQGILENIAGILFGRPGGAVPQKEFKAYDEAILQVVCEEMGHSEMPIVTGMDFGHTDPMFVLPYGVEACIDCDQKCFSIEESAVGERFA